MVTQHLSTCALNIIQFVLIWFCGSDEELDAHGKIGRVAILVMVGCWGGMTRQVSLELSWFPGRYSALFLLRNTRVFPWRTWVEQVTTTALELLLFNWTRTICGIWQLYVLNQMKAKAASPWETLSSISHGLLKSKATGAMLVSLEIGNNSYGIVVEYLKAFMEPSWGRGGGEEKRKHELVLADVTHHGEVASICPHVPSTSFKWHPYDFVAWMNEPMLTGLTQNQSSLSSWWGVKLGMERVGIASTQFPGT